MINIQKRKSNLSRTYHKLIWLFILYYILKDMEKEKILYMYCRHKFIIIWMCHEDVVFVVFQLKNTTGRCCFFFFLFQKLTKFKSLSKGFGSSFQSSPPILDLAGQPDLTLLGLVESPYIFNFIFLLLKIFLFFY